MVCGDFLDCPLYYQNYLKGTLHLILSLWSRCTFYEPISSCQALFIQTRELAAIKIIKLEPGDDFAIIQQEILMMKDCTQANIVAYYGTYLRRDKLWICMEYCGGGSMQASCSLEKAWSWHCYCFPLLEWKWHSWMWNQTKCILLMLALWFVFYCKVACTVHDWIKCPNAKMIAKKLCKVA